MSTPVHARAPQPVGVASEPPSRDSTQGHVEGASAPSRARVDRLPGIGGIHAAIVAIMGEVGGVGKTRKNKGQDYMFRGIADIKLACQPLLAKYQVHLTPHAVLHEEVTERTAKSGGTMMHIRQRIEFRFYHSDGSYFPCVTTGESMDSGDKASNKCMSAAMKYALDQVFCLPEEDPEADTEHSSPELGTKNVVPTTEKEEPKPLVSLVVDGLTVSEMAEVGAMSKRAGYKMASELKDMLHELAGVPSLRLMDRKHLQALKDMLQKQGDAAMAQDVDEFLPVAKA